MSTSSAGKGAREPAPAAPAPVVPTEDPAAYDENRLWKDPPWGDTYWCEMCSTCMRWRYSQRIGGRVCVTAFNFNFPLVIIENGRCNEYRPVPGAEGLWADDYEEEEDEYGQPRHRDMEGAPMDEDMEGRQRLPPRRRSRRRPRRGGGGSQGGGGPI